MIQGGSRVGGGVGLGRKNGVPARSIFPPQHQQHGCSHLENQENPQSVPHIWPLPPMGEKQVLKDAVETGEFMVLRSYSAKVVTER